MFMNGCIPKEWLNEKYIIPREKLCKKDVDAINAVEDEMKEFEMKLNINNEELVVKVKNVKVVFEYFPMVVAANPASGVHLDTEEEVVEFPTGKISSELCHDFVAFKALEKFNEHKFNVKRCDVMFYD